MRNPPRPVPEDPAAAHAILNKRVRIVGLKSQADLNGAEGNVTAFNNNGRYAVKLIDPPDTAAAHPELIAVKPINLELVPHYQTLPGGKDGKLAHLCSIDAPTRHRLRMAIAEKSTEELFGAMEHDRYPPEQVEEFYGIKMPTSQYNTRDINAYPVGALVYNAWLGLWKTKLEIYLRGDPNYSHGYDGEPFTCTKAMLDNAETRLKKEVTAAHLGDDMLGWFKREVNGLLESANQAREVDDPEAWPQESLAGVMCREGWPQFPGEPYLRELKRRAFEGVQMKLLDL